MKSRIHIARIFVLVVALAMSASAMAQKATFKFNPPHGTSYVITKTATMTETNADGKDNKVTEVSKTRVTIAKTPTGYTFTYAPTSTSVTVNGKSQKVPQPDAGTKLVYIIDAKGNLVKVNGLEAIFNKAIADLPAEQKTQANAQKAAYIESETKGRQAEWKETVARFVGKTVTVGDTWSENMKSRNPNAPTKVTLKFAGMTNIGGRSCMKMRMTPTYNNAAIKNAAEKKFAQVKAAADKEKQTVDIPTVQSANMTSEVTRLVDPTTMLSYGETSTRSMTVVLKSKKRGTVTMKSTEKQDVKYEYKK